MLIKCLYEIQGAMIKISTLYLNFAIDGVGGQCHAPVTLATGKRCGAHFLGGWVSPRAGQDGRGKPRPHRDLIPGTVQPVVTHNTDCAIPALVYQQYVKLITGSTTGNSGFGSRHRFLSSGKRSDWVWVPN